MRGKKGVKAIVTLLLIIVAVLLIHIIRNIVIMTSVHNKVSKFQDSQNYMVSFNTNNQYTSNVGTSSYKGRTMKSDVLITTSGGTTRRILQFVDSNKQNTYMEINGEKVATIKDISNDNVQIDQCAIINYTGAYILEILQNSITSRITSATIDGKECYVIKGGYSSSMLYTGKPCAYIEKDTGLLLMVEETVDNGVFCSEYSYQFDCLTDEDMQEPDITEYKVQ